MWQATIASETRIIGHDSEAADMDNPNGHLYGEIYFVLLTHTNGKRLAGRSVSGPQSKLADAIQRAIDKGYDPSTSKAFQPYYPVYGSQSHDEESLWTQDELEGRRHLLGY